MPEPDKDAEIVALLTEHQLALRLYVQSLLPGEPSAADVAQLANKTIWEKRGDFELGTNFKAWIFSIARYEVLGFRRREHRDSRLVFSDEMEELIADELPKHSEELERRQAALHECLARLRPADRALVQHRYFQSAKPLADYAREVGRSVGGVRVSLHRIRETLAKCIESSLASNAV